MKDPLSEVVALLQPRAVFTRPISGAGSSTRFERFKRTVGLPPMEYLLAWRMAVARNLLRNESLAIAEVADA